MQACKALVLTAAIVAWGAVGPAHAESGTEPAPSGEKSTPAAQESSKASTPAKSDEAKPAEQAAPQAKSASAAKPSGDLRLAEVTICRKVSEDRTPVDSGTSFGSQVGSLFCFTDVRDAGSSHQIYHRWYVEDELVSEVVMDVKGPRWRCWSEKEILRGWAGDCRVEIATEDGGILGGAEFQLVESIESAPSNAPQSGSDTDPAVPAGTPGIVIPK